jgi:hypothetical protein
MMQLTLVGSAKFSCLMQPAPGREGEMRKPAFRLKLRPIEISSEEILADLLYPAPKASAKAAPKRMPQQRRVRS